MGEEFLVIRGQGQRLAVGLYGLIPLLERSICQAEVPEDPRSLRPQLSSHIIVADGQLQEIGVPVQHARHGLQQIPGCERTVGFGITRVGEWQLGRVWRRRRQVIRGQPLPDYRSPAHPSPVPDRGRS